MLQKWGENCPFVGAPVRPNTPKSALSGVCNRETGAVHELLNATGAKQEQWAFTMSFNGVDREKGGNGRRNHYHCAT